MQVLCIDIGGTSIKGGVISDGIITNKTQTDTNAGGGLKTIKQAACDIIDRLLNETKVITKGIAVSSAGDIDAHSGRCIYANNNLPEYSGFDIAGFFGQKYNLRCAAINDAHAAALAESYVSGEKDFIMLTLGTGVGGGMVKGGMPIFGTDYCEGKYGHITLYKKGKACACGNYGCAESYCSATALIKRAQTDGLDADNGKKFFELVAAGDTIALKVLDSYLEDIKKFINLLVQKVSAPVFVIGGGISAAKELWLEELRAKLPGIILKTAITGNDAGIIGAYYWFLEQIKKNNSSKGKEKWKARK